MFYHLFSCYLLDHLDDAVSKVKGETYKKAIDFY